MTATIIPFPKPNKRFPDYVPAETSEEVVERHQEHTLSSLSNYIVEMIVEELTDNGYVFNFDSDTKFLKDAALLLESLVSLMKKEQGLEHPLQPLAEKMFQVTGEHQVRYNDPA